MERVDSGQPVTGAINQRLLTSPLFAAVRAVPADVLAAQAAQDRALGATRSAPVDTRISPQLPMDQHKEPKNGQVNAAGTTGSPVARLLGPEGRMAAERPQGAAGVHAGVPNEARANANASPVDNRLAAAAPEQNRVPGEPIQAELKAPSQAADTFTGMRQMHGELRAPLKAVGEPANRAPAPAQEHGVQMIRPLAPEQANQRDTALPSASAAPERGIRPHVLRTFVGSEQSALNRYLSQAESLIRRGEYYKASELYDIARSIDPRNPLPLLGRALSLLAAGDYVTSANNLFAAINAYDALADFPVELPAFIPDLRVLDRRRADLERRLEQVDDYRLRFLLGYAEYCSNLQKLGLENMTGAAKAAPGDMDSLRRFTALLSLRPVTSTTRPAR